jgi:hypothetical protein
VITAVAQLNIVNFHIDNIEFISQISLQQKDKKKSGKLSEKIEF